MVITYFLGLFVYVSKMQAHTKTNTINLIVLVLLLNHKSSNQIVILVQIVDLLLSSGHSLLVSRCMSPIQQIDSRESCVPSSTIEEQFHLRYSPRPVQYVGNTSFTTTTCYYYLHYLTEDLGTLTVASVKLRCMVLVFFQYFYKVK